MEYPTSDSSGMVILMEEVPSSAKVTDDSIKTGTHNWSFFGKKLLWHRRKEPVDQCFGGYGGRQREEER